MSNEGKGMEGTVFLPSSHEDKNGIKMPSAKNGWWLRTPRPTVVFDFDGVIHSYKSGWKGETEIPDPPVPGIREAIAHIRLAGFVVVVVSTRCKRPEGVEAVRQYLDRYGIQVDGIQAEKPPAICYIDDRAIGFDGHPETLLEQIINFKPWYSTKEQEETK